MDTDRHELVGRIFIEALTIPDEERAAWLDENTDSQEIRAEVENLLFADEGDVLFLDDVSLSDDPDFPAEFGAYVLEGVIGQGGMGVVYKARQIKPNRQVAIKILSSAFAGDLLDRFEREIEMHGRLAHDAVARVYDAGVHDRRPFIVMELVDGPHLDQYASQPDVTVTATLRLFVDVCVGVAHAHARGVIHRDLKPSNILVADGGHPKVLDFGIATNIAAAGTDPTLQTKAGMILGTLQYMSPEQARGESFSVDVRSDVFALGVILFELLEGRRPLGLESCTLTEAVHRICEAPTPPLSSGVLRERRDLDIMIGKAMAKEPDRRYETVAALAADVTRFLKDEPILARPPTMAYVLTRFARRHRIVVASAAIALALVVIVTAVAFSFVLESRGEALSLAEKNRDLAVEERTARTRAVADAENARLTLQFLLDLFQDLDPVAITGQGFGIRRVSGEVLTARDILDRGAERLASNLESQPATRAYLLDAIGRVYVAMGFTDLGEPLLLEAYEIRQQLQPVDQVALAGSLFNLSVLSGTKGERCADKLRTVLDLQEKIHGVQSEEVMTTLSHLAAHLALEGRFDEAEEVFQEALRVTIELKGEDSRQATLVRLFWAEMCIVQNRVLKGLELAKKAAIGIDRYAGNSDFSRLLSEYISARIASKFGQNQQAERLYLTTIKKCEEILGEDHFLLIAVLGDFGVFLAEQKKNSQGALPVLERAIKLNRDHYGKNSHLLVDPMTVLTRVHRMLGNNEDTIELCRELVRIAQANDRVRPSSEAVAWHIMAMEFYKEGRWDDAEKALRRVISIRRPTPKSSRLDLALRNLSRILLEREGKEEIGNALGVKKPKNPTSFLLRAQGAALAHDLSQKVAGDEAAWITERFAKMAIADLKRALADGLANDAARKIAEFRSLGQRPDFPKSLR
ncbi:MAG: tetratricopeptide (TPR) repeat protein/tRNA A-37 threonylcarbamoyl transferase component Bud32 [Planctomycetota bacterium]